MTKNRTTHPELDARQWYEMPPAERIVWFRRMIELAEHELQMEQARPARQGRKR